MRRDTNRQNNVPSRQSALLVRGVSFVGHSGAGKTTLLERLIPLWCARGIEVSAFKHSSHFHSIVDSPPLADKDSDRLARAGARKFGFFANRSVPLAAQHSNELMVVEGWKREPLPKIEIWRDGCAAPLASHLELVASVSEHPLQSGLPCFSPRALDSLELLADFVLTLGSVEILEIK